MKRCLTPACLPACLPACRKPSCAQSIRNVIGCLLLSGCGLLTTTSAQAQFFQQTCSGVDTITAISLPSVSFQVSRQTPVGSFAGEWRYAIPDTGAGGIDPKLPFMVCTNTQAAKAPNSDGVDKNVYVRGDKPAAIYPAPGNLTITEDGITYQVFTTSDLQNFGLGFVVRWRVTNSWGEYGQWITPPANWSSYTPSASAGMPFWRVAIFRQRAYPSNQWIGHQIQNRFNRNIVTSLQDWYNTLNSYPSASYLFYYGTEVSTRFVVIQDPLTIPGALSLDPISKTFTQQVNVLNARPQSFQGSPTNVMISQTVTLTLPPTGSCTTPSVDPSTVNFHTVMASDIPNPGNTANEKPLNLTFTNCPRINIGYYVHANNKWVDSSTACPVPLPMPIPSSATRTASACSCCTTTLSTAPSRFISARMMMIPTSRFTGEPRRREPTHPPA